MLSLHINSFNVFGWIDELASIRMLFNWKLVSIHSNCISLCSTLPGGCLAERWSTLNDQSTLTKVALIARKHVSDFYLGSHMKPVCSTTKEGFWVNSRKSIHTLQLTSIDPSSTEPMTQLNSPKLQLSSLFFSCFQSRHTLNPRPVISCLRRSILCLNNNCHLLWKWSGPRLILCTPASSLTIFILLVIEAQKWAKKGHLLRVIMIH